jgi:hypothetical protein
MDKIKEANKSSSTENIVIEDEDLEVFFNLLKNVKVNNESIDGNSPNAQEFKKNIEKYKLHMDDFISKLKPWLLEKLKEKQDRLDIEENFVNHVIIIDLLNEIPTRIPEDLLNRNLSLSIKINNLRKQNNGKLKDSDIKDLTPLSNEIQKEISKFDLSKKDFNMENKDFIINKLGEIKNEDREYIQELLDYLLPYSEDFNLNSFYLLEHLFKIKIINKDKLSLPDKLRWFNLLISLTEKKELDIYQNILQKIAAGEEAKKEAINQQRYEQYIKMAQQIPDLIIKNKQEFSGTNDVFWYKFFNMEFIPEDLLNRQLSLGIKINKLMKANNGKLNDSEGKKVTLESEEIQKEMSKYDEHDIKRETKEFLINKLEETADQEYIRNTLDNMGVYSDDFNLFYFYILEQLFEKNIIKNDKLSIPDKYRLFLLLTRLKEKSELDIYENIITNKIKEEKDSDKKIIYERMEKEIPDLIEIYKQEFPGKTNFDKIFTLEPDEKLKKKVLYKFFNMEFIPEDLLNRQLSLGIKINKLMKANNGKLNDSEREKTTLESKEIQKEMSKYDKHDIKREAKEFLINKLGETADQEYIRNTLDNMGVYSDDFNLFYFYILEQLFEKNIIKNDKLSIPDKYRLFLLLTRLKEKSELDIYENIITTKIKEEKDSDKKIIYERMEKEIPDLIEIYKQEFPGKTDFDKIFTLEPNEKLKEKEKKKEKKKKK